MAEEGDLRTGGFRFMKGTSLLGSTTIALAVATVLGASLYAERSEPRALRVASYTPQSVAAAGVVRVENASTSRALIDKYCVTCHNERARVAGLSLAKIDLNNIAADAE